MKKSPQQLEPTDRQPFVVQEPDGGTVVVTFARLCDQERTAELDVRLKELVETHDRVICDLSKTEDILTDWLRWLQRLTAQAKRTGKRLILAGASVSLTEKADLIGLKGKLELASTVAEARA